MTAQWFDLGQRLWAARHRQLVLRTDHRLVVDPANVPCVAIRAATTGDRCEVTATVAGQRSWTLPGASALRRLDAEGISTDSADAPVLVVDDYASVAALARLARAHADAADVAVRSGAAVAGFWADRADMDYSSAVIVLPRASAQRWVLGVHPDAERQAGTWRSWLGIGDAGTEGMLLWAQRLAEGPELAMLCDVHDIDRRSWDRWRRIGDGWARPASVAGAAMDLKARCDAADLFAAGLLTDRRWRHRAVHTGEVVTGLVVTDGVGRMVVAADRNDARMRAGNAVVGWAGSVDDMPFERFVADVTATAMTGGVLHVSTSVGKAARPSKGDRVVLMPAPPVAARLGAGRGRFWSLYERRSSWLSTGATPVPTRRDVPLDILIAGAEDAPHTERRVQ